MTQRNDRNKAALHPIISDRPPCQGGATKGEELSQSTDTGLFGWAFFIVAVALVAIAAWISKSSGTIASTCLAAAMWISRKLLQAWMEHRQLQAVGTLLERVKDQGHVRILVDAPPAKSRAGSSIQIEIGEQPLGSSDRSHNEGP